MKMHIEHARWSTYRIPLHTPFTTAHNSMGEREGAIVELFTSQDGIVGVGEIAPLPDFGGGTLSEALAALTSALDALCGKTTEEALAYLHDKAFAGALPPAAACGIEIALLDALGKAQNRSIGALLAADRPHIPRAQIAANAVVGAQEVAAAAQQAGQAVEAGFSCIKLKMGRETAVEIERVRAVRAAIGPSVQLRLDANEGWTYEQARTILSTCAEMGIQYVEQPLPAGDIGGLRELQRVVAVPLAADEAAYDLASVRTLLQSQAVRVLIIKPQLVGGLGVSRAMIRLARSQAVGCVLTSVFESGIGLAAVLHLAASSPEIIWACGLATLDRLVDDLLLDALPVHNGFMTVPAGPGLGVRLDREALLKYSYAWGEK